MAIKVLVQETLPQGLSLKDLILSICGNYKVQKVSGALSAEATLCWFHDRACQPLKYEPIRVDLANDTDVAGQIYAKVKQRYSQAISVPAPTEEDPNATVLRPAFEDC